MVVVFLSLSTVMLDKVNQQKIWIPYSLKLTKFMKYYLFIVSGPDCCALILRYYISWQVLKAHPSCGMDSQTDNLIFPQLLAEPISIIQIEKLSLVKSAVVSLTREENRENVVKCPQLMLLWVVTFWDADLTAAISMRKEVKQRETARVITMHSSNLIEDFMRCVRVRMDAHVGSLTQPTWQ